MSGQAGQQLSWCGQEVKRRNLDCYKICLIADLRRREALFALLAFHLDVSATAHSVSEPMLGMMRLQWWREAVESIFSPPVRQQAIVQALARAVDDFDLPCTELKRLILARERDLDHLPPADQSDLLSYLDESSVPLFRLMHAVCTPVPQEGAIVVTGRAWGVMGLLRSSAYFARRRQIMFPADAAKACGLCLDDYYALRTTEPLKKLVKASCELTAQQMATARHNLRRCQGNRTALLPFMVLVHLEHYLRLFRRADFDPFALTPESLLGGAPLWTLLWRLWRIRP